MDTVYKVKEIITNNIVRAVNGEDVEVLLIGKGIGFSRHKNDVITSKGVHNIFELKDKQEKNLYNQLLKTISPKLIELANDSIDYIQNRVNQPVNEHIHIALTDHIAYMVRRCKLGVPLGNPFEIEIENLYPKEYKIAKGVVEYLSEELNMYIPKSEVSFITLHIVSALSSDSLASVQKHTKLMLKLINVIESSLMCVLDRQSLNYVRLITHLRFAIERVERKERLDVPKEFSDVLREKHKELYTLAYKLVMILQKELNTEVSPAEITYLTIHLYQFAGKM